LKKDVASIRLTAEILWVAEVSNSFIPNYTLEIYEGCCLDTPFGTSATDSIEAERRWLSIKATVLSFAIPYFTSSNFLTAV